MSSNEHQPPHCKVILAGTIAKTLQAELAEGVKQLPKPPLLVGFLATTDPAAKVYSDWTSRQCKEKCVPKFPKTHIRKSTSQNKKIRYIYD
jgi:methylenetetrahydrofolate dehydrogenase (NAD+)